MNTVAILGRLTKDIEVRQTTTGKAFASFCVAVDAGKDTTYFIDCTAWEKTAENIGKFFKKGDKIAVTGCLTTRMWEDDNGGKRKATEVRVLAFDFCAGKTDKIEEPAEPAEADMAGALPFEC